MMENPIDFVKRPIGIVGMGLSGEAAKRLLLLNQVKKSDLFTFDDKPGVADYSDPVKMLDERDPGTLVVSPGYPLAKDWLRDYEDHGGSVTSELALALHFLTTEKVIGVTGSVGKSTTVSLLEAGLKKISPHSFVGGNIGVPLADYVSDLKEKKREVAPWIVLELSSYQLENCGNLRCAYSAITYFTPNHMERYDSLNDYYDMKWKLVKRTDKAVILNQSGGDLAKYAKGRKEMAELLFTDHTDEELTEFDLDQAKLLGAHNQDNLAVAAKLARECGWGREAIEAMKEFPGLPHRMENCGEFAGIRFVNDSKATTIESVKTAAMGLYHQMDRKKHLILLLGGKDKNLPWQDLEELKKIQKLRPIFFGEVAAKAKQLSKLDGPDYKRLWDAMVCVQEIAQKGDTVLLSPGGTSLDQFKNFEERGRTFLDYAKKLFR